LNRIAFEGVAEKRDPTCIDRLLLDFIKNASWDMDPEDLGYVKEGLKWFSPEDECERRWLNRMRNSPFESEAAFILFQIGQLQEEEYVELIEWIKGRRERLIELGIKSPEIDNVNWIVLRYGNSK
jgi:hypothetical protein